MSGAAGSQRRAPAPLPSDVFSLFDHERHAQSRLDPAVWAYLQGGAADEFTCEDNLRSWAQLSLRPRVLRPTGAGHTHVDRPGLRLLHPIMVAPTAAHRLFHPDGEIATALAAAAQGAGLVLSTQASVPMAQVAHCVLPEAGRGPLWFQLYCLADRAQTLQLVRRAEQSGFEALVLTVDAPVQGPRDRERRAGFRLPAGIEAVNLQGLHMPAPHAQAPGLCQGLMAQAPSWEDVSWLRSVTSLPVWLKGITHPDDARIAQQRGVSGVVVSNHGGRVLDTMPSTAEVLPDIREAVGADMPLIVDGGIRRGTDVLKALALGADAVMIGRPILHGLATAGAVGVAHVIRLLRDEFEIALALTGCASPADVTPAVLGRSIRP